MLEVSAPSIPQTFDEFLHWEPTDGYKYARKQVTICLENDICSAAPVLPDFSISVNNLFAQPE